ncbi:MAG: hypothetical protein VW405_00600 [Rhodospirillaceae bacterium]
MSASVGILLGIIGLLVGGILFRRAGPGGRSKDVRDIQDTRDKALDKNKEAVRKDVEKLEERRKEIVSRPKVSDALNELIDKGEL